MDFWSRLLSPLSSGGSRKDLGQDPAKRLQRFEKQYSRLLNAWRASSNLSRDSDAAETLEIRLQELTNILSDESRRPLPHPCIQYCSLKQIYVPIGKIATTSYNEWIIKEAVLFFATLIESEEEAFVENQTFSASLTNLLVRITGLNSVRLGLDTESRVVELAFNITTKIRLDPSILPAWFKTHRGVALQNREKDERNRDAFVGRTQKADFPLFYILMDYIHHEGKVGDFARTGLLYIIEAASSSGPLEQWIVESDLSTLMATGLGALYSQLSRKLVVDHLPHNLPPILAFSDYEHPTSNYEVISSCSPEFQSHLETFLSHLLFWQDVLNHCRSVEVKSTLLEHFQVIFLQQLLYPSLLESSDIDGGSSVAVLTYLRRILESLDHPDMINLILHYLLALPDNIASARPGSSSSVSKARKRKSMDLATMLAERAEPAATPLLFNLVDLILACLRSRNQQTIHVTLQLVSAILKRHHRYAIVTLLRTDNVPVQNATRTVGAQEQEVEFFMSLAGTIGGEDDFDEVYQLVLRDTMTKLEAHPCSLKLVAPRASTSNQRLPDSLPGAPKDVADHTLRPDDPLLNSLLDLLETFFVNQVETNLSVTETLVDLAVCGFMKIEGWLTRSPSSYIYDDAEKEKHTAEGEEATESDDDDDDLGDLPSPTAEQKQLRAMEQCRQRPQWSQASLPRVFSVLRRLEEQVASYKRSIPHFDELVQQRRDAFRTADAMLHHAGPTPRPTPISEDPPDRRSFEELSRNASPSRPSALEGLAHRLLSELGTPSRASSPRGRKELGRTPGSGNATPGKSGLSSSKEASLSRGRGTPVLTHSPERIQGTIDPTQKAREEVLSRQTAEFATMGQTILSKKVGLPQVEVEPISIKSDKEPVPEPTETADEPERPEEAPAEQDDTKKDEPEHAKDVPTELDDAKKDAPEDSVADIAEQSTAEVKDDEETNPEGAETTTEIQPSESEPAEVVPETVELPKSTEAENEDAKAIEVSEDNEPAEESEAQKPEANEPETTEPETKEPEVKPSEAQESAVEESEAKQSEIKESEVGEPTPKDTEAEEDTEAQQPETNDTEIEGHEVEEPRPETPRPKSRQLETLEPETPQPREQRENTTTVSVSHVVTNVIILQSFLFELAALIQVRAGLFDEVRFV
ncbi:retinoic acid induced 16 [Fusarium sporotrichioides]|uniref:Retinoic acid induced 16 n=1 Tax=Fusarium sporotrichioides TaxID=5514 RepID=A0A395S0N5_FUSSP|nr:retinoic acid induced 16 [Fusarium sporotrichioides]